MSLGTRDAEAFALVAARSFAGAFVVGLDLEMQTRRLTLRAYGTLHGGSDTYAANIAFFGVTSFTLASGDAGSFPQSARIEAFDVAYDDAADLAHATLTGARGWVCGFGFDGVAFEEHRATIASLADDDEDEDDA